MTAPNAGDLVCPQCGHSNPPKSDYCWECRYDFLPDDRPQAKQRPPIEPKPIPPPYSQAPSAPKKAARQKVSFPLLLVELAISAVIVYASWMFLRFAYPTMSVTLFVIGWAAVLLFVLVSEGQIPEIEPGAKYWSLNPFDFEDNRNRQIMNWHVMLFLPRIVFRTIRHGLGAFSSAR